MKAVLQKFAPSNPRGPKLFWWVSLGLSFLWTGCITDGPNRTGSEYLSNQNFTLSRQLRSVVLEDYPVDGYRFQTENSRSLSECQIGRTQDFEAAARVNFSINPDEDIVGLELDLFYLNLGSFHDSLMQGFSDLNSLRLLVKSVRLEGDEDNDDFRDSIRTLTDEYFRWNDSVEAFASFFSGTLHRDTLVMDSAKLAALFDTELLADALPEQTFSLEHLGEAVVAAKEKRQFISMELSLLDTGIVPGILRCGDVDLMHLEEKSEDSFDRVKHNLEYIPISRNNNIFYSSFITHPSAKAARPVLLSGPRQSLHIRFDRDNVLQALASAADFDFSLSDGGKAFNNQYYVPFASLSLPLDTGGFVEGNTLVRLQSLSGLDSVPELMEGGSVVDSFTLDEGEDLSLDWEFDLDEETITFAYWTADDVGYLGITHDDRETWDDTLRLSTFQPQFFSHRGLAIELRHDGSSLTVFLRVDRNLGEVELENSYGPDSTEAVLGATRALQRLLFRTNDENNIEHDLTINVQKRSGFLKNDSTGAARDTLKTSDVMSEVPLKIDDSGRLLVDLTVYLMKL